MRLRRDVVFLSSVLFTIALLLLMPPMLENAGTWRKSEIQVSEQLWLQNYYSAIGFASLANIFVGLIVTWTGYVKRVRWTWFVMFTIVRVWAFPILILPTIQHWKTMVPIAQWLPNALQRPGIERDHLQMFLIFLLMVIALLIPIKSFFGVKKPADALHD